MLRLIALFGFLTAIPLAAFANDTALIGYGGSVVRMGGTHSQVRMTNEYVRLDLYKDYYKTSCNFEFDNEGAATTVLMGFPERYTGDAPTDPVPAAVAKGQIKGFATTVDGLPVVAKRMKVGYEHNTFVAYWTKTVPFSAHQKRRIHVEFQSPYGDSVSGKVAAYDFTGGNWRGKVATSDMIVSENPGAPDLPISQLDYHEIKMRFRLGGRQFDWHNWKAEGHFVLSQKKH